MLVAIEKKLFDTSHHYDLMSVRAGIQEFTSDFRGFLAVLEAPGVRIFGTLGSSRVEYNAAVFDALEKGTPTAASTRWRWERLSLWQRPALARGTKRSAGCGTMVRASSATPALRAVHPAA